MTDKYLIDSRELLALIYNPFKFLKIMKSYKIKDFHKAIALNFDDFCGFVLNSLTKHNMKDFQNKYLITQNNALYLIKHYLNVMDPTFIPTVDN